MDSSYPLGYYQKALWYQQAYPVNSPTNNMTTILACHESLTLARIDHACSVCYKLFPLLRGYFVETHSDVRMHFQEQDSIDYDVIDLSHIPEKEKIQHIKKKASEEIDIKKRLIKLTFFQLSQGEFVILISWHHIIADIFSLALFAEPFLKLLLNKEYTLKAEGSYFDFIAWQEEYVHSDKAKPVIAFWENTISRIKHIPNTPIDLGAAEIINFNLNSVELAKVNGLCAQEKMTQAQFFFIAFQLLLHDLTSTESLVTMTPVNTRVKKDFIQTIGYYVNFLPIISQLHSPMNIKQYCEETKAHFAESILNSYYPVNNLFDIEDTTYENMFKHIYKYQNETLFDHEFSRYEGKLGWYDRGSKIISLDDNLINYPRGELTLIVSLSNKGISGTFHYVKSKFDTVAASLPVLYKQKISDILNQ
jgi:hypothetical protein